ncbi:MAG: mannitol-1-phosphate 5-dehydrogenase [Lentisphaerae bacterium]|jgi:mannitol-1-phosphate 5-dehydrogenase|nr:mannitol-1-phosphate 5-dehydrogenase [Lentisphaerota bacterium]MBT4814208.1 mannitol-1-phosphate 5-dehydrogenase [Lentisphaerota bacterium]MBT5607168.1 mannitol-1-phosphate 5-dehydrogenase [Lentisphaerota bacterium]MBT7059498.1 mannitol-1-phosphate 5-dehydrogenase [Lentisphaerota bacterium]MBT7840335.1 mannitol-1-phosphate 5-dehydrogenase [Lentisphaerota bacterium]
MRREAVIFGAGNIGRGFIGQLFCESGYRVTFVDIDRDLIAALNDQGSYRLETVFNDTVSTAEIGPVKAVQGTDEDAVASALAAASVGATAVGAGALKYIARPLAAGITARAQQAAPPLNMIICENLKGAAAVTQKLVAEHLRPEAEAYFRNGIGFVDTVIGRMVPMPTPEMRRKDPTLIRVEPYKELPVDRSAFVGDIPEIAAMSAEDDFSLFTARKLYVHNCGHALLAYAGYLRGYHFGYEALADEELRQFLLSGLGESLGGIVHSYGADPAWLQDHVRDLVARFANKALGDTVFRLGRDPVRKLSSGDRLAAPAVLASETGSVPRHLAWGIAAALHFDPPDDPSAKQLQTMIQDTGPAAALEAVSGIDANSNLSKAVASAYQLISRERTSLPSA